MGKRVGRSRLWARGGGEGEPLARLGEWAQTRPEWRWVSERGKALQEA